MYCNFPKLLKFSRKKFWEISENLKKNSGRFRWDSLQKYKVIYISYVVVYYSGTVISVFLCKETGKKRPTIDLVAMKNPDFSSDWSIIIMWNWWFVINGLVDLKIVSNQIYLAKTNKNIRQLFVSTQTIDKYIFDVNNHLNEKQKWQLH